jgi:hypothetical protein
LLEQTHGCELVTQVDQARAQDGGAASTKELGRTLKLRM